MELADLVNRFVYHAPDEAKASAHEHIRESCLKLAQTFEVLLPDSREKSLAVTSLEETMMWANAALARMDADGNRL